MGVALLALVSTGCGSSSYESGGSAAVDQAAPQKAIAPQQGQPQQQPAQENAPVQAVQQERQLIRTATVDLRADDVVKAVGQVKNEATGAGGYAGQENTTRTYGSVTLRVPADKLDGVIERLKSIGEVTRSELRSEDVTEQLVDVEARIATQRASVERMRVLFERAATTGEIAQIEGELTKRQSELESLLKRSESLKGKVALATLTVQVSDKPIVAPAEARTGFGGAFLNGWDALVTGLGWIIVAIGAILPFAVFLGVPATVLVIVLRRRKRVTQTTEATP